MHGMRMVDEGADMIDVGGESTRPGAEEVSLDEERRRVLPVLEGLLARDVAVSVDTMKPQLMQEALSMGVAMVNDVNALRADGALAACASARAEVCLMHMQGTPRTMQIDPHYDDVVAEVEGFLLGRAQAALAAGICASRIWLDPGFGFGKTLAHNLALFRALPRLAGHGYRVLVGVSRKSMWQHLLGRAVDERMPASIVAAVLAAAAGVSMVRVHDVRQTRDALRVAQALSAA